MSDLPPWLVLFWILLGILLLMVIIIVLCILLPKNQKPSKSDKLYNDIINASPSTVLENASKKYFDVIFCTNDSKKVFGHRCILFTFSDIFEAFFNESNDIPIEIEVDFPESIVSRAIEFCYGKTDGIHGFEEELIEFAEKYSI
uniref:BTB domain-containing protein n=1 Tax=Panagrolaimus davidi TaxID=227884 RepID=A0A914NYF6_9BILA